MGFINNTRPSERTVRPNSFNAPIRPRPSSCVSHFAPPPNDLTADSTLLAAPPRARLALTFRKISTRRINGEAMRFAPSFKTLSAPLNSQIAPTIFAMFCTSAGCSRSQALNWRITGARLCASSPIAGISCKPMLSHKSFNASCNALVCSMGEAICAEKSALIRFLLVVCMAEAFNWRYSSIFASIGARNSTVCASPNISPRLNCATIDCSAVLRADKSSICIVRLKVSRIAGFIFSSCICTI